MKTTRPDTWDRLLTLAPIAVCAVIWGLMLWKQPFFGLMDDHKFLRLTKDYFDHGVLAGWWDFFRKDLDWGMFRPTLPVMFSVLYGIAGDHPMVLFTLNFLFSLASLLVFGTVLLRVMKPRIRLLVQVSLREALSIYLLGVLLVPWTHDLFLHPSLQEKLVLLAGALSLLWFGEKAGKASGARFFLISFLVLFLGFSTKAQFAMFLPAIVLFLAEAASEKKGSWARPVFVIVASLIALAALRWLATFSGYTQRFGAGNLLHTFLSGKFLVLLAAAALGLVLGYRYASSRAFWRRITALTPAWLILGYLAIFVQWDIVGYLLSSIAPTLAFVAMLGILAMPRAVGRVALGTLFLGSLLVSSQRSFYFFGRLHDVGRIVFSTAVEQIAREQGVVYTSCPEAAVAMHFYVSHFRRLELPFAPVSEFKSGPHDYYMGDSKLCPLDATGKQILVSAGQAGGFQLFQ